MEILELKGKCFLPKIHSLSFQKERKIQMKKKQATNEAGSRYYSFSSETPDLFEKSSSPLRPMPYRTIDSVLQTPCRNKFKLSPKFSYSSEKEPTGVLTSFQVRSRANTKSPLRFTNNLYKISKSLIKKDSSLLSKKFLEVGCQIDFN